MSSVKKRAVRRRPLVVPLSCLAVPCLAWPRQAERCRASPCRASPSRAANSSKNKKGTCWQGIQTPGKSQDRAGHPKPACANFSLSPPEQKKFTLSEIENQQYRRISFSDIFSFCRSFGFHRLLQPILKVLHIAQLLRLRFNLFLMRIDPPPSLAFCASQRKIIRLVGIFLGNARIPQFKS